MCDVRTICPRCGNAIMYTDTTDTVDGLLYHAVCGIEKKTKVAPLSRWEQERIKKLFSRSASHG